MYNTRYVNNFRKTTNMVNKFNELAENRNILIIGALAYALSFVLPLAGRDFLTIGTMTAVFGTAILTRPLVFSNGFRTEPLNKWGKYLIDGPPEVTIEDNKIDESADEKEINGILKRRENYPVESETSASLTNEPEPGMTEFSDEELSEYYALEDHMSNSDRYKRRALIKPSTGEVLILRASEGEVLFLQKAKDDFICPLCGESVPWNLKKCPACGIVFQSIEEGLIKAIGGHIDDYGRSILPEHIIAKAMHLNVADGIAAIYGTSKETEGSNEIPRFDESFLAGISAIN